MTEQLIKSKQRVQQHGEVFTPRWMVEMMLDIPEIKVACEQIHATFLEPAAGDGNFLLAILERKLQALTQQYDKKNWKTKSLFALASIYGIEFLADNLEVARDRLFIYYLDWYETQFGERLGSKTGLYRSAHFLIHRNIVRGNTLTKRHPDTNELIVFWEWQAVKGNPSKVSCKQVIFADMLGEKSAEATVVEGQLSLFEFDDDDQTQETILPIQKVYQLRG
ncbi:methylase [Streptococcus sp. E24BD]|uniref:methylase n=1 Tax=Streptococcus sp. E24BD TaxID=3278715 RepID=UPI00359E4422